MDDIMTAEAMPTGRFNIFTGILKAGGGDGEPMTLSGVASSTVEDLHGDRIERTALKDMERQVANGLTIFLNHSYRVPEDVAGYASAAKITKRGEDAEGNAIWDLDMEITINDENPRATEAWRGIRKKGAKVGLSIGANIPHGGYEVNPKTGAKTIKRVNLLETSIVGIPANPRSWIAMAVKSLDVPVVDPRMMTTTMMTNRTTYNDNITIGGSTSWPGTIYRTISPDEVLSAPPADDRDIDPDLVEGCPTCGEDKEDGDDCGDAYHRKDTSPDQPGDKQDDSEPEAIGDPGLEVSSEASGVEPLEGDAGVAAAIESLDRISGEVTPTHLQFAVDIARSLAVRCASLRDERDEALRAKSEAERERDSVIRQTDQVLVQTAQIIKAVGDMPVGRKTVLHREASKLKHLEGVFGAEFMKMLEK
jgi:HK97 family phage prohead protease